MVSVICHVYARLGQELEVGGDKSELDVWEAIQGRRSIRSFKTDRVAEDLIRKLILEAGIWAPSGGNAQTWRFVAVTDPSLVHNIKMVAPGISGNPPAVIVICQDLEESERKGGKQGRDILTLMDTALAAQNIMLVAYEQGLGTCAIASFHAGAVHQILRLPPSIVPQLLLSLGYPHMKAGAPKRNTKVVWFNGYSQEG
jgi:nitroreductase